MEAADHPAPLVSSAGGRIWAWTGVRVVEAFDLSRRSEYARLDMTARLERAVSEQAAYLDRLLGLPETAVVALRLVRRTRDELECYLIGRVEAGSEAEARRMSASVGQVLADVPPEHVRVEPMDGEATSAALAPFEPHHHGLAQIHKRVRVALPHRLDAGVGHYAAIEPFGQAVRSWDALFTALCRQPHRVAVSIELTPRPVPTQLHRMLEREATRYGRLAVRLSTPGDVGGQIQLDGDAGARVFEPIYLDALRRYDRRVFQFSITVAAEEPLDDALVEQVGAVLSPALSQREAAADPRAPSSGYAIARPANQAEFAELATSFATIHPTGLPTPELEQILAADRTMNHVVDREPLRLLRRLVDRAEAGALVRLPIAIEGRLPGIRVAAPPDARRRLADTAGPALLLGHQGSLDAAVTFPVRDLPRHGFIVGTPGSGKTNTALNLCRQLWPRHRIPFLVIEPVNSELNDYRWLATLPEFEDLLVFTVGDDHVAPFRLNPFQVPEQTTVASHISNLLACFEAAFGLWDPLPFLYRRALLRTYGAYGLHAGHRAGPADAERWPVLADFVRALGEVVDGLGYAGEVRANIDSAARLRAESLLEGPCGSVLSCRQSYDMGVLMSRPVVVELAGIGDNAKEQALCALFLITAMRGWYRHHRRELPHVTLMEEAHRIFPRVVPEGDHRQADASRLASERIAQGLAEDRKYGESYLLIDQQVGKVAEDAYKITNLKIMHRTSAASDRELLGSTMAMHTDQLEVAATLRPFQAVVSHNALDTAVSLTVPDVRAEAAALSGLPEAPLAEDSDLQSRFQRWRTAEPSAWQALAPYSECEGCQSRCLFRSHAEWVVSEQAATRDLFDDPSAGPLASPRWYSTLAERLADAAGTSPSTNGGRAEDYYMCVFSHALRLRYPPRNWTAAGREKAQVWMRNARTAWTAAHEDRHE